MPEESGVYQFLDNRNNIIYVGKAKNLKSRVSSYFTHKDLGPKTALLVSEIRKIKIISVNSELESLLLEANLIKKLKPKFNIKLTDGKSFPLIRITVKDSFPKVLQARREEDKRSIYFGPYPNTGAMRLVLKTIRRIFPYESALNHPKKTCLYYHLGLCPCCEVFGVGDYKKNIRRIVKFLKGQTKEVIKELEKERNQLSKEENYEKAKDAQKKIDAINYVTSPIYKPFEYELNPNLRSDTRIAELSSLKKVLIEKGVEIDGLNKIECFDISNTSGNLVTASLVVFIGGEPDKKWYRRFKIKNETPGKPNDFSAMKEVIERRLRNTEWPYPDLFVVDGGKGQVSVAQEVLNKNNVKIPLIGIAKREETIITRDFKEIKLTKDVAALRLIMRIRDEAHRFAITYHKKLRRKALFD